MAASYFKRGMNGPAIFELFARDLPPHRHWLLAAGIGPALTLVESMRFGDRELAYLAELGFADPFLSYLQGCRFTGEVDALPEGTIAFAGEPLVRVTAPRIEAQLLETLLLNQVNFQTAVATKAARIVFAAGGGHAGSGGRLVDFSPRRDHGVDAAMKVARSAAIAGAVGTSNVAAAMHYGLEPVGTMAHSYVMSFGSEEEAFRAFMEDSRPAPPSSSPKNGMPGASSRSRRPYEPLDFHVDHRREPVVALPDEGLESVRPRMRASAAMSTACSAASTVPTARQRYRRAAHERRSSQKACPPLPADTSVNHTDAGPQFARSRPRRAGCAG